MGSEKKKNSGDKRIKKRNGVDYFTIINVIEEEDNNKKKAKAKTPAEVVVAIAVAAFEADDIYKDNA